MAHTRNGRAAKERRQERARDRATATAQYFAAYENLSPDERLLHAIFGTYEECTDCGNQKLINADCQTPQCKALRGEKSVFYDHVDDNNIDVNGAIMFAGIDY